MSLPVQDVISNPGPFNIPGTDGATSGVVSGVKLTLTRDVTTENREITYWKLEYGYYNGSFRWEWAQELYIDFVDEVGTVLVTRAITVGTPSAHCHYGGAIPVINNGTMDFDFRGRKLALQVTGATTQGGRPGQDHKC